MNKPALVAFIVTSSLLAFGGVAHAKAKIGDTCRYRSTTWMADGSIQHNGFSTEYISHNWLTDEWTMKNASVFSDGTKAVTYSKIGPENIGDDCVLETVSVPAGTFRLCRRSPLDQPAEGNVPATGGRFYVWSNAEDTTCNPVKSIVVHSDGSHDLMELVSFTPGK